MVDLLVGKRVSLMVSLLVVVTAAAVSLRLGSATGNFCFLCQTLFLSSMVRAQVAVFTAFDLSQSLAVDEQLCGD